MLVPIMLQLQFALLKPFRNVVGRVEGVFVYLHRVFKRGAVGTAQVEVGARPAVVAKLFRSFAAGHRIF